MSFCEWSFFVSHPGDSGLATQDFNPEQSGECSGACLLVLPFKFFQNGRSEVQDDF